MDGCRLHIISGIDGSFHQFDDSISQYLYSDSVFKYRYDRSMSFKNNLRVIMNSLSDNQLGRDIIVGWSIGAVVAVFISEKINVEKFILINAFFDRAKVLTKRKIFCDEQVYLKDISPVNRNFIIIRGEMDTKIPPQESSDIYTHLSRDNIVDMFSYKNACHDLVSFPSRELAMIINYSCK